MTIEARREEPQAGTFTLTPEEVEALDQADDEAEEDARAGRVVPIADFLAELRRA